MREDHPIDQYFRDALRGAEVQPPPSVWEGVRNGRRRKRGFTFWSRRRGFISLALLFVLGVGAFWMTNEGRTPTSPIGPTPLAATRPGPAEPSPELAPPQLSARSGGEDPALPSNIIHSARAEERAYTAAKSLGGMNNPPPTVPAEDPVILEIRAVDASTPVQQSESSKQRDDAMGLPPRSIQPSPASSVLDAVAIDRMVPIHAWQHTHVLSSTPESALTIAPYVLPRSDWWLAVQVGGYDVRRQWSGEPMDLKDALNASETWTSTLGVGALIGRTWRSGWGISLGAEHERSEQAFHHEDHWTRVDQEITTSLVTLNTTVFYSHTDTVSTQVQNERISDGIDQRSVIRIPVEGHWRNSWRRWNYGISAGVAGEFTSVKSNSILVQDEEDGHITSAVPQGNELRGRYPTVLLGTLAVELGYLLDERWTLWASPAYMHSLGVIGTRSDVFAQPERFGLRLRLSYMFNSHCTR